MLVSMSPLEPDGSKEPIKGTHMDHYSSSIIYMKPCGLYDSYPLYVRMLLVVLKHELDVSWVKIYFFQTVLESRILKWHNLGFPGAQWWRISLHCRRCGFDPQVRKIPWRRKWQPIPVFLPRKSHGQRRLAGYSPGAIAKSQTQLSN